MTEYCIGTFEEKAAIIDFINYVFSQAHRPHDFKRLRPVCYADHTTSLGGIHYLAKEDGAIRAMVTDRRIRVSVAGKELSLGLIGNVSVHPYARGSGYMKELMPWAMREAEKDGVDYMLLGGLRQRYGYFGFDKGGWCYAFLVTSTNLLHTMKDVDISGISFRPMTEETLDLAQTLYEKRPLHALRVRSELADTLSNGCDTTMAVYCGEKPVGYVKGEMHEVVLESEAFFPQVLKAYFTQHDTGSLTLSVAAFETERAAFLASICESYTIQPIEMIHVFRWQPFLEAFLSLKAMSTTLTDGDVTLSIDGVPYRIVVKDNAVSVTEAPKDTPCRMTLNGNEALRFFFELRGFMQPDRAFGNWLPLPLWIDSSDTY